MQLTGASGWQSKGCRRRGAHTAQRQGARIARCAPCTKRCAPGSWWAAATTPPARPARLARRGPRSRGQAPRQRRGGAPRAAAPAPPAMTAWSSAARSAPAARQAQLHIHPTLSYPIRASGRRSACVDALGAPSDACQLLRQRQQQCLSCRHGARAALLRTSRCDRSAPCMFLPPKLGQALVVLTHA